MNIVLTYESVVAAIASLWTVYKCICYLMDRYQIGSKRKEKNLLKMASVNLMREVLRNAHREARVNGYIDEDELEHIELVYDCYHKLGGNSVADRWIEEMRKAERK